MIVAGIDSGAYSTKVVLMVKGKACAETVVKAGTETTAQSAEIGLGMALSKAGIPEAEMACILVTGRGKSLVPFASETVPDILCLAQGIYRIFPSVQTVLDVGADKSLAIRCSRGRVLSVAINDKCAAGTGSYLQMVSTILNIPLEKMGEVTLTSTEMVNVDSTCAVFAESEIISLIHAKNKPQDILNGVYRGLALRLLPLLRQVGLEREVALVGGVALHSGLRRAMEEQLGYQVLVPQDPQTVSALGAAIIAETKDE